MADTLRLNVPFGSARSVIASRLAACSTAAAQRGYMVDRSEARRLYIELLATISSLDSRLFEATEGEYLGVDPEEAQAAVGPLVTRAADLLRALANLDRVAGGLMADCEAAAQRAVADPYDVVELDEGGDPIFRLAEAYRGPLELRALADRLGAVYGLQSEPADYLFSSAPEKLLFRMCGEIGETVEHLVKRRMIRPPSREDHVKHVLYSVCRAAFPDALPDGQIVFGRILKGYKPDLGVPGLKTCVELKVARSLTSLDAALGQVIVDTAAYGSDAYTKFITVIYATCPEVTQEVVQRAIDEKMAILGAQPRYAWIAIVARGPFSLAS